MSSCRNTYLFIFIRNKREISSTIIFRSKMITIFFVGLFPTKDMQTPSPLIFCSFLDNTKCAELNKKLVFQFLFIELSRKFVENWGDLSIKLTKTLKIEIGKIQISKVVKFTWKMRIVLNRKKNQISDYSNFYFSSYCNFCTKNCQLSMNFHDNSKNNIRKNRKLIFHLIQHIVHRSHYNENKTERGRGGGVCISLLVIGLRPL